MILSPLITPPETETRHPMLYRVGGIGLILILLGLLGGKSLQNIGMVLLLVSSLGEGRALYAYFKRDPLLYSLAAWCGYVAIRTLWAIYEFPETAHLQMAHGFGMLRIAFIVIVAFWIGHRLKAIIAAYSIALIGILITILIRLTGIDLASENFGALNIHHSNVGLIVALALAGWVIFEKEIREQVRLPWVWQGTWVLVSIVLFQVILFSKLRIIWGALVLWGLYRLLRSVVQYRPQLQKGSIRLALTGVSAIVLCIGLFLVQYDSVSARWSQEKVVMAKVQALDFSDMPVTSFGTRIYLWKIGLDAVGARPLWGWGPGTTPLLIQRSNVDGPLRNTLSEHTHLHNTYLELLTRTGFVGLLLMGMILFLILRAAWNASYEGPLHAKISSFSLSALFILGVASLTDNYMRQVGWFFLAVIGGAAYALKPVQGTKEQAGDVVRV